MKERNKPIKNIVSTIVNPQTLTEKLISLYSSQDTLPKLIEDTKIKAQSLDEYYVKLQILLSEDDEAGKAALRDKVVGEKKLIEIENIFKAIDTERKIRELLSKEPTNKNDKDQEEKINNVIKSLNAERTEESKIEILCKNLPNKSESEIKNIIESINRIQSDIGKILLLGGAGVGKTTLLHNISYKWGKGELWNDKFDYVFRVKLKELLNTEWLGDYTAEQRQDKLACFIHYCLTHSTKYIKSEKIQLLKDILSIEEKQKNKVLLLLDGYDEVAHLNMSNRNDFKDIIDEVSEYKNVIMSSRPNAVVEEISNRFERKVENTGWDTAGIEKYVNKNFEDDKDKEFGTQLKSFLAVNSQIKEICEVPINTALICLVWGNKDIREKLQKDNNEDFNISQLYQEVIGWLNNRHLDKTKDKYKNKTEANNYLKTKMNFLEYIAHDSLIATGKLVESKLVENKKDTLDIDEVIEHGLLRKEGINYQFIHLTFQEYLTACYLKDQLVNDNTKDKAASFIGKHRNEPKYLMTLKFLAGIVANEDKNESLVISFWEAVTCNVDGTLELGLETKVTLLMHLLAQSKVNGKFDNRIPNLKQIQELIDDTILEDITSWEQQIIGSGYLSEAIIKIINEKLQNQEIEFEESKTVIEIITSLANKPPLGGKTKVYKQMVDLLQVKDQVLQKLVLEKLIQIIDGTIEQKTLQVSLKTIVELIKSSNDDVKYAAASSLPEVVKAMPSLATEAYKELLELLKSSNDYAKLAAARSLTEVVKAMPSLASEAYKELLELLKSSNDYAKRAAARSLTEVVKAMPAARAYKELVELLKSSNDSVKYAAARSLSEVLKAMPVEEAYKELVELLKSSNDSVKYEVASSLTEVVKVMPAARAYKELLELLKSSNGDVKSAAARSLTEVVKAMPSLATEALKELVELLKSSNDDVKYEAARSLSEVLKAMPVEEAYKELLELLKSSNYYVKYAAVSSLTEVVKAMPVARAYKELVELLKSSNDDVKYEVASSLTEVVKAMPAARAYKELLELLKSSNASVKYAAASSLPEVVKAMPSLATRAYKELVELLKTNDYVKKAAAKSLTEVIKVMPAAEAYKELLELLKSSNYSVNYEAARSLTEVVKALPAAEAYKELVELLKNSNDDVKYAAASSLPEVVKAMPAARAYKELVELLKSSNDYVKEAAASSLTEVVKAMPAAEAYKELLELLKNSNYSVKEAAAMSLTAVVKVLSFNNTSYELVKELLKIIVLVKTQEFDNDLQIAIKTTLKKITEYIGQEYEKNKNSEMIEWFNNSFQELPKISETRIFLKEICKSVLKSGVINEPESIFILKCVQKYGFTFTVSISKEQRTETDKIIEGKIIFEDRSYKIFKKDVGQNHNGIVSLEDFAKLLLEQTNDPLAKQYKDNEPLFKNSGTVLKIAACDLKSNSIINNVELHSDKWQLSLMYLSNHKKATPSKVFILLERKGEFGEHVIHKIYMTENGLQSTYHSLHPQNVNTKVRKEIFGEMEYISSKPRYYGSIFEIGIEAEEQLKKIAKNQDIIGKTEYEILRDILASIIDSEQLNYTWEEYIKHSNNKEFKKAELLKKAVKRESVIIDKFEDIEIKLHSLNTIAKSGQHTEIIKSLTEKVAHLFKRDKYNQDTFSNLKDDIEVTEEALNNISTQLSGLISIEHGNNV